MDFQLHRVQVWSAEIPDRPGGAAGVLAPLAEAGVNLEFIWTRRLSETPGKGVIFVAPVTGATQTKAAHAAGFEKTADMVLLRPPESSTLAKALARVESADHALGALITLAREESVASTWVGGERVHRRM